MQPFFVGKHGGEIGLGAAQPSSNCGVPQHYLRDYQRRNEPLRGRMSMKAVLSRLGLSRMGETMTAGGKCC